MIIKTGKASKKFDEYKLIYLILFLLIISIVIEWIFFTLPSKHFSIYYLVVCCAYILCCTICIYLLLASRLSYVIKHPVAKDRPYEIKGIDNYFNILDIADYLPKASESFRKKHHHYFNNNLSSSSSSMTAVENDPISSNPNNFFFNRGLEMLSSSLDKEESRYTS